jgi:hypothetical protein
MSSTRLFYRLITGAVIAGSGLLTSVSALGAVTSCGLPVPDGPTNWSEPSRIFTDYQVSNRLSGFPDLQLYTDVDSGIVNPVERDGRTRRIDMVFDSHCLGTVLSGGYSANEPIGYAAMSAQWSPATRAWLSAIHTFIRTDSGSPGIKLALSPENKVIGIAESASGGITIGTYRGTDAPVASSPWNTRMWIDKAEGAFLGLQANADRTFTLWTEAVDKSGMQLLSYDTDTVSKISSPSRSMYRSSRGQPGVPMIQQDGEGRRFLAWQQANPSADPTFSYAWTNPDGKSFANPMVTTFAPGTRSLALAADPDSGGAGIALLNVNGLVETSRYSTTTSGFSPPVSLGVIMNSTPVMVSGVGLDRSMVWASDEHQPRFFINHLIDGQPPLGANNRASGGLGPDPIQIVQARTLGDGTTLAVGVSVSRVVAARFDPVASTWGPVAVLHREAVGDVTVGRSLQIVAAPGGDFYVVYSATEGGTRQWYTNHVRLAVPTFAAAVPVEPMAGVVQPPAVATSPDGTVWIAYARNESFDGVALYRPAIIFRVAGADF